MLTTGTWGINSLPVTWRWRRAGLAHCLRVGCGVGHRVWISPGQLLPRREGCCPHAELRSIAVRPVTNVGSPRRPAVCTLQAGVDFLPLGKLGDYLRERQFLTAAFYALQQRGSHSAFLRFALLLTVGVPMPWHGACHVPAADVDGGMPFEVVTSGCASPLICHPLSSSFTACGIDKIRRTS